MHKPPASGVGKNQILKKSVHSLTRKRGGDGRPRPKSARNLIAGLKKQ